MAAPEPLDDAPEEVVKGFLKRTSAYWHEWVRALAIPFEWQEVVIRAAITLKLCSFEETGAIIAAVTTSIPEAPGSQRNWDYRYCWLRDAYFVILALNRLGATKTMERYVDFITTVAAGGAELKPLYGIVPDLDLTERIEPDLAGFLGHGPVRVGNQAAEQIQHDVFGSVVLAVAQSFVDQRLPNPGDEGMLRLLESLASRAACFAFEPDAGIWEYRGRQRVHTHSALLCWVACDRVGRIAARLGLAPAAATWHAEAQRLRERILREVPGSALASDQPYRETDLAVDFCEDVPRLPAAAVERIVAIMEASGMTAKLTSIHVNGWFGHQDKLAMTRTLMLDIHGKALSCLLLDMTIELPEAP